MKKLIFLFLFLATMSPKGIAQSKSELRKQQLRMIDTLIQKISGVKYVDFRFSKATEQAVINNISSLDVQALIGFKNYITQNLGLVPIITNEQRIELSKTIKSQCDIVNFNYDFGEFKSTFMAVGNYPFTFSFIFCDKSEYTFKTKMYVNGLTIYHKKVRETCAFEFAYRSIYDLAKRLRITYNPIIITENNFNTYLDTSTNKLPIEGIYKLFSSKDFTSNYKLGIFNLRDTIRIIYFDGANFEDDWKDGESKGFLLKTNSENDFFAKWISLDKTITNSSISFITNNSFLLTSSDIYSPIQEDKYIRIK